jgi:hypothetical protein
MLILSIYGVALPIEDMLSIDIDMLPIEDMLPIPVMLSIDIVALSCATAGVAIPTNNDAAANMHASAIKLYLLMYIR